MKKLERKFIDTDSNDYKRYKEMVTLKFQFFLFFFLYSLFFLISSVITPANFRFGIFLLIISAVFFFMGNWSKNKFSFEKMIRKEAAVNIDKKFVQKIKEKRHNRIKAVILCVELVSWLISFLIIDSIADDVRQVLGLHTLSDFILVVEMLLISLVLIFALQKFIYWITTRFTFLFCKAKDWIKYFVYNGTFVSGYIVLTVVEKGLTEILNKPNDNRNQ